jgi:Fe-S-cluster containining protein
MSIFSFLKEIFRKKQTKCHRCGKCCQQIYIYDLDKNILVNEADFYEIKDSNYFYKNLTLKGKNSAGEIYFSCNLLINNKCSVYKLRPKVCVDYPDPQMFENGGGLIDGCGFV